MKLVVLESPYAGDVDRNVAYARAAVGDCLRRGEAPIASHLLFTQPGILDDDVPEERRLGIDAGLAWHAVADAIVFYLDLGWSSGMYGALDRIRTFNMAARSGGRPTVPVEQRRLDGWTWPR